MKLLIYHNVYPCDEDGCITDEQNDSYHNWRHSNVEKYFEKVSSTEILYLIYCNGVFVIKNSVFEAFELFRNNSITNDCSIVIDIIKGSKVLATIHVSYSLLNPIFQNIEDIKKVCDTIQNALLYKAKEGKYKETKIQVILKEYGQTIINKEITLDGDKTKEEVENEIQSISSTLNKLFPKSHIDIQVKY